MLDKLKAAYCWIKDAILSIDLVPNFDTADFEDVIENKVARQPTLKIYKDKRGEFRWTVIAVNGKKLATSSEGYKTRHGLNKALKIVKSIL